MRLLQAASAELYFFDGRFTISQLLSYHFTQCGVASFRLMHTEWLRHTLFDLLFIIYCSLTTRYRHAPLFIGGLFLFISLLYNAYAHFAKDIIHYIFSTFKTYNYANIIATDSLYDKASRMHTIHGVADGRY